MSTRRWTLALTGWTLLVWTTRIGNIWDDADLSDGEKWGRTALALSFTLLAVAVAYALWRRAPWGRSAVVVLVGWTIAVWAFRAVGITTGDHEAAFILVHLALAVVSVTLSTLALREAPVPAPETGVPRASEPVPPGELGAPRSSCP